MTTLLEASKKSQHGTWVEIRLHRLIQNLKTLKNYSGTSPEVMAVIKANAYGHGLLEIAKSLAKEVSYLGVSCLREALELKEHEIKTPIFIFGRLMPQEIPVALMDDFTLSVSSFDEAKEISDLSTSLSRQTRVHIKIDTGMGRLGIPLRQAVSAVAKMTGLGGILPEGIYTHFPTAEQEDGFTEQQLADFASVIASLKQKGITFRYRHAANSAGIITTQKHNPNSNLAFSPSPPKGEKESRGLELNLIRPGLMLYGIYPDPSLSEKISVAPILSLKSRILSLKRLKPGESAGYGRTFVTDRATTIAILPIGYSHGYPFSASNKSQVLYKGQRYHLAGRVSMDYLTVDLGETLARVGDEVTLIGEDQGQTIRAEDLAAWTQTIPYEIVTRLLPSLPRFYR